MAYLLASYEKCRPHENPRYDLGRLCLQEHRLLKGLQQTVRLQRLSSYVDCFGRHSGTTQLHCNTSYAIMLCCQNEHHSFNFRLKPWYT